MATKKYTCDQALYNVGHALVNIFVNGLAMEVNYPLVNFQILILNDLVRGVYTYIQTNKHNRSFRTGHYIMGPTEGWNPVEMINFAGITE